jgi:PAS domain S-box-containing protein
VAPLVESGVWTLNRLSLNIGQEIFLALSLVVVVTLAVAAVSISFLQQISGDLVDLAERNRALESAALQLRIAIEQQNDSIHRFMTWVASNPDMPLDELAFCRGTQSVRSFLIVGGDPRLVSYSIARRGYDGAMTQLGTLVSDADSQRSLWRISNRYAGFEAATEAHLIELCQGRPPAASTYWQWPEGQQLKDILVAEVDSLIAGLRRQIDNEIGAAQRRATSALALAIGLTTVALVGGTAAGFAISQSLTRSVRSLVVTAQAIKQGDLSIQVTPTGPEELHFLTETVNDMAASLDRSHRQLEAALAETRRRNAELAALNAVAMTVSGSLDLEVMLSAALDKALEVMGVEVGAMFLLHGNELRLTTQRGLSPNLVAAYQRVKVGDQLVGRIVQSGQPILVEDVSGDFRATIAHTQQAGLHAFIGVPLKARDRVIGAMALLSYEFHPFVPADVVLLTSIANGIALAVENAKLFADLEQSEAKYRRLTEEATDIVFAVAGDGTVTFINQRIEAVAGYRPEEMIGRPVTQFLADSERDHDLGRLVADLEQAEGPGTFELCIRTADGGLAYLEVNATPIVDNGRVSGYQGIARDITEKKRLEQEIARRTHELQLSKERQSELRTYVGLATQAVEEERKRLARELHDDTAQALVALGRRLDSVRDELRNSPAAADRRLEEVRRLTDQILDSVRRFSRDLRPAVLDDLGLLPALEWLSHDVGRRSRIQTRVVIDGQSRRLSPDAELGLFRIAQEALTNVTKHAQATEAVIHLSFDEHSVQLAVADNGVGFVVAETSGPDWVGAQHMGVLGMRERAELLGGRLQVSSEPGSGTMVAVELPE